jgi:hypothetical protein
VLEVIIIGGSLPDFLRTSCTSSAFSAPVVSMPVSLVLRGVKKLRVSTAFGGSLTAVDGTSLVNLLAVYEVSLDMCLLWLLTSWKLSSWALVSTEVLFITPIYPAFALTLRKAFSSFIVTVYMP